MFARTNFPSALNSQSRRRGHNGKPDTQRNIPAAFFGLIVTGLFAVTLAEPNWFRLYGGECAGKHLGLYTIFGLDLDHLKEACMNNAIMIKLRCCAAFALLGVIMSLFQFALDVCGANKCCLRGLRRNSFGHIVSVFISVVIMALCYWITTDVSKLRMDSALKVSVRFDAAFYLVIGAGVAALIATTLNLLRITCERRRGRHVCYDDTTAFALLDDDDASVCLPPVPPPAYEP